MDLMILVDAITSFVGVMLPTLPEQAQSYVAGAVTMLSAFPAKTLAGKFGRGVKNKLRK